jgi:hypothetical protein
MNTTELTETIKNIADFQTWGHADKIRFFAWYLHRFESQDTFSPSEIGKCYNALNLSPPSAVAPFLVAMVSRSPQHALRSGNRYRLEGGVRDGFESRYGQRPAFIHVQRILAELPSKLPDLAEQSYLQETLVCFRHKAFRAAVVMCWNLVFDHLCHFIISEHLTTFNAQLPKTYPKADISAIIKRDDFGELKESQVLQVCKSARIISDGIFKILKEKLDRRNMAAHPSGVAVNDVTAEEIIRDLLENVLLKLT